MDMDPLPGSKVQHGEFLQVRTEFFTFPNTRSAYPLRKAFFFILLRTEEGLILLIFLSG